MDRNTEGEMIFLVVVLFVVASAVVGVVRATHPAPLPIADDAGAS